MLEFEVISAPKKVDWIEGNIVVMTTSQTESRKLVTQKGMSPCTSEEVERYALLQTSNKVS